MSVRKCIIRADVHAWQKSIDLGLVAIGADPLERLVSAQATFSCDLCGLGFFDLQALNAHKSTKHGWLSTELFWLPAAPFALGA